MIITTDHGPVRELQLNRPPVNALTLELLSALRQGIEQGARDRVRALIVSGQNTFSAGLDIRLLMSADRAGIESLWRELYQLMKALAASPIPIAAAITGHAPAGGTVISLFCDWRVAARGNVKLGLTEVQVGIPLPPIILAALRRQVGPRQAELLATGGLVLSSEQAYNIGLVDELAAPGDVVQRALQWCQTRIALPPQAMLSTRSRARADLVGLFEADAERELRAVIDAWWSPEAQTTLRAIVDRMLQKPASTAGDR